MKKPPRKWYRTTYYDYDLVIRLKAHSKEEAEARLDMGIDLRPALIKQKLKKQLGNSFGEYFGNKILKAIKKSSQLGVELTVKDKNSPPRWFSSHPWDKEVIEEIRKSDNKKFYAFLIYGD